MRITVNTCYTRIIWIMSNGPSFAEAISKMTILKGPYFEYEGVAGYVETEVEFEVKDLVKFTNLWESYYKLTDIKKADLYGLAKGLGDCK